jgi:hypothetical protein
VQLEIAPKGQRLFIIAEPRLRLRQHGEERHEKIATVAAYAG